MNNFNIEFPYPIGTYLSNEQDGITHIDQLREYIIDKKGISVVVMLDALTVPRLSTRIDMDYFLSNWSKFEISNDKTYSNQRIR